MIVCVLFHYITGHMSCNSGKSPLVGLRNPCGIWIPTPTAWIPDSKPWIPHSVTASEYFVLGFSYSKIPGYGLRNPSVWITDSKTKKKSDSDIPYIGRDKLGEASVLIATW